MAVAKFIIIDKEFVWQRSWIARKCFNFFFLALRFIPVIIFTARDLLFKLITQWCSYCPFHLFIFPSPTNVRFVTLSLDSLFMVFQNSVGTVPLLILIVLLKKIFAWFREGSLNRKYLITCLLYWLQEGWKVKIRYYLW